MSPEPTKRSAPHPVVRRVAWVLATWFGCGRAPRGPGTMGTLGAVPLYLLVMRGGGQIAVAVAAVVATFAGVWASSVVAREVGRKDPQFVVVDEVAGFLVAMIPAPFASWQGVVAGFVAFRLFDITKPWPIRRLEGLPSGWGIMMDDIAAGVVAAGVVVGLRQLGVVP